MRDRPAPNGRAPDLPTEMEALAATAAYHRGEEIYGPDDPADHWYRVTSGLVRKCAVRADGRRQIVDFLLPGEFFGLIVRNAHQFTAEAVTEGTTVASYPRRRVEMLTEADPRIGRLIREVAFEAISRSQARALMLGRMSATEKVAAFLLEMAGRAHTHDGAPKGVVLSMSRYDIGDYLALAAETVSRSLTDLQHQGAIRLAGAHRVRIIDLDYLTDGAGLQELGRGRERRSERYDGH